MTRAGVNIAVHYTMAGDLTEAVPRFQDVQLGRRADSAITGVSAGLWVTTLPTGWANPVPGKRRARFRARR